MEDDLRRLITLAEAQNILLCTFALDCVCQEFTHDASADNPWVPFPEPTRVHVLVDASDTADPHRRFRAEYRPQVVRWYRDATARTSKDPADRGFVARHHVEIGDGHKITSYAQERRWRPSVYQHGRDVYLTGEHFLLCRFGRRKVTGQVGPVESEPVRLARAILEPERAGSQGIIKRRTADWQALVLQLEIEKLTGKSAVGGEECAKLARFYVRFTRKGWFLHPQFETRHLRIAHLPL